MLNIDLSKKTEEKIDVLCHAAGIIFAKPYMETTVEELRRSLEINVVGMDVCSRSVLRHMIQLKDGKIVVICSAASREGKPNLAHYTALKYGDHGPLQSIALSVAEYGINVNGLCPGFLFILSGSFGNIQICQLFKIENTRLIKQEDLILFVTVSETC
jgi:sorbitol-6-phosphate 2-dehydrogenase